MSTMQSKPAKARRALSAKTGSLDENAVRAALLGKTNTGKVVNLNSKSAFNGPRRALGDVSNANRPTTVQEAVKEALKPAIKIRPASQSNVLSQTTNKARHAKSLSASSTSKPLLSKHDSGTSLNASHARSKTGDVAPGAPKLEQGPWQGAEDYEEVLKPSRSLQQIHSLQEEPSSEAQAVSSDSDAIMHDASTLLPPHTLSQELSLNKEGEQPIESETESADDMEEDGDDWMQVSAEQESEQRRIVDQIQAEFKEELDFWDTTMVAEYSEEIFAYMESLEAEAMPNPNYMLYQTEIDWSSRASLIEWLMQTHMRYHMLPETLWIAINIIDRFLSHRVVSLVKLQLVGITAIFLAAKYEEIMAPSVEEFVLLSDHAFSREEIIKGERIMLQSLDFNISPYCTPYSWLRRISKADDYDIQTRTLSKFCMEVTLQDHRFLRAKPSMIAAIGMYSARKMLGGEWDKTFIFYSSFAESQLEIPLQFIKESLVEPGFTEKFLYKKYSTKKFLKASIFAVQWATQ